MSFLDDYEPVEDRLRAFWADHPNGRVGTELIRAEGGEFIVKASVWLDGKTPENPHDFPDSAFMMPSATGLAQERETQRGVNATSALENCETSAIGRALANLGYAAKGKRPSREEMSKSGGVSSTASPAAPAASMTERESASREASDQQASSLSVAGDRTSEGVGPVETIAYGEGGVGSKVTAPSDSASVAEAHRETPSNSSTATEDPPGVPSESVEPMSPGSEGASSRKRKCMHANVTRLKPDGTSLPIGKARCTDCNTVIKAAA